MQCNYDFRLVQQKIEIQMIDGLNRKTLYHMVVNKELEHVWLHKIPWMLRWVQLLVLMDCSCKLIVVVGSY